MNKLEVKSFVTSIENDLKQTIQGGKHTDANMCTKPAFCVQDSEDCDSVHPWYCDNVIKPIKTIKPIIIDPWRF